MLNLQKKIIKDDTALYQFEQNGQLVQLTETDAQKLIQTYPAEQRNCKISNGRISMKQGCGNLPSELIADTVHTDKGAVKICTHRKYLGKCYAVSNDKWFINIMYERDFIRQNLGIIRKIDGAEITDWNMMQIKTPYMTTDIVNLSTGLKSLLNIKYIVQHNPHKQLLLNATECGDNILPYIFKEVSNTGMSLYIAHPIFSMPQGYTIYVNGEYLKNDADFMSYVE